jgi:hypothetical protein
MQLAIDKTWLAVQNYADSTTQVVLNQYNGRAVQALAEVPVFGPETTKVLDGLQCPLHTKLLTYVTLAYANECLSAMNAPLSFSEHNEIKYTPLMPIIKPIAEYYVATISTYRGFTSFKRSDVWHFFFTWWNDIGFFGFKNAETTAAGLRACLHAARLTKDKSYFTNFVQDIYFSLYDKAAEITGTQVEVADHRAECVKVIAQYPVYYDQWASYSREPTNAQAISATHTLPATPSLEPSPAPAQGISNPGPESAHAQTESEIVQKSGEGDRALAEAKDDLEKMIGLPGVKDEVSRLISFLEIQLARRRHGLRESSQSLHFVFTGNPGTGKTTVARILGKIFFGFGILKTPKLTECDRAKLIGAYLGQTAIKTDEVVKSALDGVLFIDEAYALTADAAKYGYGDMYGDEAISTLVKRMEDFRDRLIVIVAGYPAPMETFLRSNPGLKSRFTRFIRFGDYDVPDLCRIFEKFCRDAEYSLTASAYANSFGLFAAAYHRRDESFGNARFVRNVYEAAVSLQAARLVKSGSAELSKAALVTIEDNDIPLSLLPGWDPGELWLADSYWEAACPGCGLDFCRPMKYLGQRVTCKCGQKFRYPWWNVVASTVPGLPDAIHLNLRQEDKVGILDG